MFVSVFSRCLRIFKQLGLEEFSSVNIQVLGAEDTYGANASSQVQTWRKMFPAAPLSLWPSSVTLTEREPLQTAMPVMEGSVFGF